MNRPLEKNFTARLRDPEWVFTMLTIGIVGSLVFWPLLNSILSILLFIYWLVFINKKFSWSNKDSRLVCLFAAMYLLVLIGCFYSDNVKEAMFKIQQKSALLVFPIVLGCSAALPNEKNQKKILLSFAWFTLAGCFVCLLNGAIHFIRTGNLSWLHGYDMVILKDTSPFILAIYCFLSIASILYFLYQRNLDLKNRKWYIVIAIFLSLFLLLLGNRNILICWTIMQLYFFYRFSTKKSTVLLFAASLAAVLVAAVVLNPSLRRQWTDAIDFSSENNIRLDEDQSLGRAWGGKTIRLTIWKCSWDIIKKNWATGVGTGDVQDALQVAYENRKFYFASRYNRYNAHDQYIQETIAYGITGLVVLIGCLLVPLYRFSWQKDQALYCLFLLCFVVICLTESILELNKGIVFYSFFNSLFAFTKKVNS